MAELIIISDDLTGALDTAVQFAKKGAATVVMTDMRKLSDIPNNYDVITVNTESRHLSAEKAADAVRFAADLGGGLGVKYYYKKIDSTLRGNVGAELEALLDACESDNINEHELMLIPSYCKLGRTIKDGRLYVNGVPLHETAFNKDPLNPMNKSGIADIIAKQSNIPVVPIKNLADLPFADKNKKIYLFDAETDEDIYEIGEYLMSKNRINITAGSAGFAEFLSDLPVFPKRCAENLKFNLPMLTVCGSLNEVSRRQAEYAAGLGHHNHIIGIDIETPDVCALKHSKDQAVDFLKKGDNVIIKTNPPDNLRPLNISDNLGHFVKSVIDESSISTLTVFGGDTCAGILNNLGIFCLEPLKEIMPGVALSKTVNSGCNLNLITKAGGFGGDDLIEKIVLYLNLKGHQ